MDVQVSNIKSIIIAIASLSGDDIEKVCEECGLDIEKLDDVDAYVPWEAGSKSMRLAFDKTMDRLIALRLGMFSIPAMLGSEINELFTHSPSFLQSGIHFAHFSKLIGTMYVFDCELTSSEFKIKFTGMEEHKKQDILSYKLGTEINIISICQICRALSQERILPKRFEFELDREQEVFDFIHEMLPQATISTHQEANAIVFDRTLIEIPNPYFNRIRYNQKLQAAQARLDQLRSPELKWRVNQLMYDSLQTKEKNLVSLEETAAAMNTTTRTLTRRLQEAETSYNQIKDEVRKKIVNDLIVGDHDIKIDSVAYAIGMDVPQFSAWFKKAFEGTFNEYKR